MKILFALDNYIKYYAVDDVVRELYRRGHEIVIVIGHDKESPVSDDALQKAAADMPSLRVEPLIKRKVLRKVVRTLREILNYAHILTNEDKRPWDAIKWGRFFEPGIWKIISSTMGKKMLKNQVIQKILRVMERIIPVAPEVKKHLRDINPDIVVAMPLISGDSREGEYVQAASALHIPSAFSLFSWDNSSTKGTFHSQPDFHIVWNEPLAQELVHMHGIPRHAIHITGAPRFDQLGNNYILPREEFCRAAGIDPSRKFILYAASTFILDSRHRKSIGEDQLILKMADVLLENAETADLQILVRPHPQNAEIIPALHKENLRNLTIYPQVGELPTTEEKRRKFYNSIFHSAAVVGINTTAFLEAAVIDKPCVTVVEEIAMATHQLPHFHHLADAGFLETAHQVEELAAIFGRILQGSDAKAEQRRKFVGYFICPTGSSSVQSYANLVEAFVNKKTPAG
jgi:hypothetical protein